MSSGEGGLKRVLVPEGYVGGPFKFYRKECFSDIGDLFVEQDGMGSNLVRAKINGWRAGELESIKIIHLRRPGRRMARV